MIAAPQAVCTLDAVLGEGPVWDVGRNCLWFVDIKQHRLHRFDPDNLSLLSLRTPEQPCWVFPCADGSLLLGAKAGVHRVDLATESFALLHPLESDLPGNRLNDAAVHPDGSVWFGTMDNTETVSSGRYYRLQGGRCTLLPVGPMVVTNGPAFSPDGRTVYFVDTLARVIHSAPVDGGGCGPPRVFAQLPESMGYPDGPVADSEGTLWVGLFGGWGVARFAPDGSLLGRVAFPVANVTKVAFGGADLRTVFATSARKGLSNEEIEQQPDAGSVFRFAANSPGQCQARLAL